MPPGGVNKDKLGASAKADRAGGLRPEPQASQPKPLIPCALCAAIERIVYSFERTDAPRSVDDAFIWEGSGTDRPLVTYGDLRRLTREWRA